MEVEIIPETDRLEEARTMIAGILDLHCMRAEDIDYVPLSYIGTDSQGGWIVVLDGPSKERLNKCSDPSFHNIHSFSADTYPEMLDVVLSICQRVRRKPKQKERKVSLSVTYEQYAELLLKAKRANKSIEEYIKEAVL